MRTSERLAALERADFDSFGQQDVGPGVQPLATPEEVETIKADVLHAPWTDLTRIGDCLNIALEVLGGIATGDSTAAHDATQALRRMMQRTVQGEIAADVEARSW